MAAQETWFVFGRKSYEEALTQVGTVRPEPGKPVEDAARTQYGSDWLELVAIPEARISWAIRED